MAKVDLESMMIGLVNCGVKKVCVYYDGAGDSGSIESIRISTDLDTKFDDLKGWDSSATDLNDYNSDLYSMVYDFCSEQLLDDVEDWWNNDGGWGNVLIDVEEGTYKIENNIRITDYELYIHEGKMFEKNTK